MNLSHRQAAVSPSSAADDSAGREPSRMGSSHPAGAPLHTRVSCLDVQRELAHNHEGDDLTLMDLARQALKAKQAGDYKRARLYLTALLVRFERKQTEARRELA